MNIEELKQEMEEDWGFSNEEFKETLKIIYFVGIAQDLAWRPGAGVLRRDLLIKEKLLNYLIQGIITLDTSQYGKFDIYRLGSQSDLIFQELLSNSMDFPNFKRQLDDLKLNSVILKGSIHYEDNLFRVFHKVPTNSIKGFSTISDFCNTLLSWSHLKEKIIDKFNKQSKGILQIIESNNLAHNITDFQAKRINDKFMHIEQRALSYLEQTIPKIPIEYVDIINKLNILFPNLFESVENPMRRQNLQGYNEYCEKLVNRLNLERITTKYDNTKYEYFFNIKNPDKFKNALKEEIESLIKPVENYLMGDGNVTARITKGAEKIIDGSILNNNAGDVKVQQDKKVVLAKKTGLTGASVAGIGFNRSVKFKCGNCGKDLGGAEIDAKTQFAICKKCSTLNKLQ